MGICSEYEKIQKAVYVSMCIPNIENIRPGKPRYCAFSTVISCNVIGFMYNRKTNHIISNCNFKQNIPQVKTELKTLYKI